jgi:hypothetical protein
LEVNNLKQILKSYEDQNIKLADMEKKLKNQNIKHEKLLRGVEEKYKERIKSYQSKLNEMERESVRYEPSHDDELDRVNVILNLTIVWR